MKIKKNDKVLVTKGKDRGETGKILKALPKKNQVVVEGVNLVIKHIRPRRAREKGQRVKVPAPMDASNVKLICPKCKKAVRIGYKIQGDQKKRYCKKCAKIIS